MCDSDAVAPSLGVVSRQQEQLVLRYCQNKSDIIDRPRFPGGAVTNQRAETSSYCLYRRPGWGQEPERRGRKSRREGGRKRERNKKEGVKDKGNEKRK